MKETEIKYTITVRETAEDGVAATTSIQLVAKKDALPEKYIEHWETNGMWTRIEKTAIIEAMINSASHAIEMYETRVAEKAVKRGVREIEREIAQEADARRAFIDVTVDGRTFMLYKVKTKTFYVSDSRMNIRPGDTLIIRMRETDKKIRLRVLCTFEGEQGIEDGRVICSVMPEEEAVEWGL